MKKVLAITLTLMTGIMPTTSYSYGGHSGGAIAGGVLGGMALGALLTSRPRRVEREVVVEKVYVDTYGNPIAPASAQSNQYIEENTSDYSDYEEDYE